MNPREFEQAVAERLKSEGYDTELGPYVGDYGVDIVATRGAERLAVQAKMYGGTSRPVNRQMIMELHGAAAYLDCTGAIIATDGRILGDAAEVANKLRIRVLEMGGASIEPPAVGATPRIAGISHGKLGFAEIWERYVMPLQGRTLTRPDGSANVIEAVDWSGVLRVTSNGRRGRIRIEIFEFAVDRILAEGSVTRTAINDNYVGRASSGVILILSQVPFFELLENPLTLRLRSD